jgi:two-component system, OmpR family, sensor histidine kinase BaeS
MSRERGRRRPGASLGARLFVAMSLVILAGAATLLVVSLLIAPAVFRTHLAEAGVALDAAVSTHVEEGFSVALAAALAVGVVAAALVGVIVAAVVARRVTRPVADAASAATRLADGEYGVRMAEPGMGPELADLAVAVNTLAERLETAESRRQALLSDLAHELRTPLAALEATVEAVADGVIPLDHASLASLTAQTQRLARLTHDLSAASRSDEHAFTVVRRSVDLASLADTAVAAQAARYAARGVLLSVTGMRPVPAVADPDRVAEVLDQLLDNALRHCAPGDAVTLTVARSVDIASIEVADTGTGFPSEDAARLFERFTRGTDSSGSGIGLTIARALARAQGGDLRAASDGPGTGARFRLVLASR